MAYVTGTATDRNDLWTKLLAFLTSDAALVAAGQAWQVVWSKDSTGMYERTLKGKGLSGTDEIYVSLRRHDDQFVSGESVLWITGSAGATSTATNFTEHPNSLGRYPGMFLDNSPMQYWFVANGRRFIVVVKISTIYNAMYGGLFLPYSTPVGYTYPLFVGGSRGFSGYSATWRAETWRAAAADHYRMFVRPFSGISSLQWFDSPAAMLDPSGVWKHVTVNSGNYMMPTVRMSPWAQQTTLGGVEVNPATWTSSAVAYGPGYQLLRDATVEGLDGEVPCTPFTLGDFATATNPETPTIYGTLDGCFEVSTASPTSESIFQMGGVDHIIFPNIMRTTVGSYWALALE